MDDTWVHLLRDAIMVQAAEDYRTLRAGGEIPEMPQESILSIKAFFKSEWAKILCGKLDPRAILQKLRRESI